MLRRARPRSAPLLRLLMLVLVGLSVFGTSLASALTDIHMLGHTDAGVDTHGIGDDVLETAADAEDSASVLLHALVHCVHCHGHGSVLPIAVPAWVLPLPPLQPAPVPLLAQLPSTPPESLFRPPIAA